MPNAAFDSRTKELLKTLVDTRQGKRLEIELTSKLA